jgi:hypothetical protein
MALAVRGLANRFTRGGRQGREVVLALPDADR